MLDDPVFSVFGHQVGDVLPVGAPGPQRELVPGGEPVPGARHRPGGEHLPDRVRIGGPWHGGFPVAVRAVDLSLPGFEPFGAVAIGPPAVGDPTAPVEVGAGERGHVPNFPVPNLPLVASSNTNRLAGLVASAFSQPNVVVRTRPWPDVAWLICSMKKSASSPVSGSVTSIRSDRSRSSCWVRRVPLRLATGMVTMGLRWAYRVTKMVATATVSSTVAPEMSMPDGRPRRPYAACDAVSVTDTCTVRATVTGLARSCRPVTMLPAPESVSVMVVLCPDVRDRLAVAAPASRV